MKTGVDMLLWSKLATFATKVISKLDFSLLKSDSLSSSVLLGYHLIVLEILVGLSLK